MYRLAQPSPVVARGPRANPSFRTHTGHTPHWGQREREGAKIFLLCLLHLLYNPPNSSPNSAPKTYKASRFRTSSSISSGFEPIPTSPPRSRIPPAGPRSARRPEESIRSAGDSPPSAPFDLLPCSACGFWEIRGDRKSRPSVVCWMMDSARQTESR
jgi:hypothetical protein